MEVGKICATAVAVPAPRRVVSPEEREIGLGPGSVSLPASRGWSSHFCNSMTAIVIGDNARRAHPPLVESANLAIQLGKGGAAMLLFYW